MSQVWVFASREHYLEHMLPIFDALPAAARGGIATAKRDGWTPRSAVQPHDLPADALVMVAADVDNRRFPRHRVVYVEHGAGQSYDGDPQAVGHGSYSGGDGHENTAMFICPSYDVQARWLRRYPTIPARAVGSPKLDRWLRFRPRGDLVDPPPQGGTVAFTFHWDNPLCPEARTALPHYRDALPAIVRDLRDRGWRVLGHGHPRHARNMRRVWAAMDVPWVPNLGYVLDHAHVLVADNTSAMFEAAAVGVGVVALNAPWYRFHVHHGLRFWDAVPGRMAAGPEHVVDMIGSAHDDTSRALREAATRRAYAYRDGYAAERAANAIMEVI